MKGIEAAYIGVKTQYDEYNLKCYKLNQTEDTLNKELKSIKSIRKDLQLSLKRCKHLGIYCRTEDVRSFMKDLRKINLQSIEDKIEIYKQKICEKEDELKNNEEEKKNLVINFGIPFKEPTKEGE